MGEDPENLVQEYVVCIHVHVNNCLLFPLSSFLLLLIELISQVTDLKNVLQSIFTQLL